MAKTFCLLALLLAAGLAQAETAPIVGVDADGFKNPLQRLQFNPGLDQREFERASLSALDVYDPLSGLNRGIYHFNYRFDQWVFLPLVGGYQSLTPDFVEQRVSNFFNNIGDITNLFNSLLQVKVKRSMNTTARLLFNTTLGLGGLWDPATLMGLPRQKEDFGQTLGFYGVPSGPYLMLPFFGPSNLRDATGLLSDFEVEGSIDFLEFASFNFEHPQISALWMIDTRASIPLRYGQLNSPFEYEKIRYVYSEARKLQINE